MPAAYWRGLELGAADGDLPRSADVTGNREPHNRALSGSRIENLRCMSVCIAMLGFLAAEYERRMARREDRGEQAPHAGSVVGCQDLRRGTVDEGVQEEAQMENESEPSCSATGAR